MGLTNSLQIGRSGLLTQQRGIEVTGNNLANVATEGFRRQRVELGAAGDQAVGGQFVGRGVALDSVTRQVSEAVDGRLRSAIADQGGAAVLQGRLERLEALRNELSGNDLSTALDGYFDAFSQLGANPQDSALRGLVVSEGASLAGFVQDLRAGYADLQAESQELLAEGVGVVNGLLAQVDELNASIRSLEGGADGQAAALRDRRDGVLTELAQYLEIDVNELADGEVDVFVGSVPVVLDGRSRGVALRTGGAEGRPVVELATVQGGARLEAGRGELAAHLTFANDVLADATGELDELAGQLIFQTNRIHSQSQSLEPVSSYVGSRAVIDVDAALNDPEASGLAFVPRHGSFSVSVSAGSGAPLQTTQIAVDLDGLGGANTTLNGLVAQLNAVDGLSAAVDARGRLAINGDTAGTGVSFSDDSSGVLAALGVNSFFTGTSAADIAVADAVAANSDRVAVARGHVNGDNRGALAVAGLRDTGLEELGGRSITQLWSERVARDAAELAQVRDGGASAAVVADNLRSQQAAVSGVNADEETINLLQYQRAYQASARYLTVVDELLQTLLGVI